MTNCPPAAMASMRDWRNWRRGNPPPVGFPLIRHPFPPVINLPQGEEITHECLLSELRRRNVFRVAAAYLVAAWLVMQVIAVISDAAGMPDWADSLALILLIAGLPVVLFIAWAFELTPDGLKPTDSVSAEESQTVATGSNWTWRSSAVSPSSPS